MSKPPFGHFPPAPSRQHPQVAVLDLQQARAVVGKLPTLQQVHLVP